MADTTPTDSRAVLAATLQIVEQSMSTLIDSLLPSFAQVGVSLRVSQEDHAAIRSALAGAGTGLHLLRAALAQPAPQEVAEPMARAHPDGRVIPESVYASGARQGGASWTAVKDYTIKLYPHPAPPAVEVRPVAFLFYERPGRRREHLRLAQTEPPPDGAFAVYATPPDLPARIRALPFPETLKPKPATCSRCGEPWGATFQTFAANGWSGAEHKTTCKKCGHHSFTMQIGHPVGDEPTWRAALNAAADLAADGGAR